MSMKRKHLLAFFVGLVVALFTLAFPHFLHGAAEAQYAFDDSDSLALNVTGGGTAPVQGTASGMGPGLERAVGAAHNVQPAFQSDDFNTCSLDAGLWTFVNSLGDATLAMTGTHAIISIPAGTSHDIWGTGPSNFANNSARIMQSAENTDFEMEVKFDSGFTNYFQMQGVLIEQDADDLLRLEFYRDVSAVKIFAAEVKNGVLGDLDPGDGWGHDIGSGSIVPLYMQVKREGNLYTQSYSLDGANWTTYITFTHMMTVTAVGTYAGNAALTPGQEPSHTAKIDYFFNTASPIVPEDAITNTLAVIKVGNGGVTKEPDQAHYTCGEVVTLTATPAPWWSFSGWSGDLAGDDSPENLIITGPHVVTATFTQSEYVLTVNTVGSGTVTLEPGPGPYHYADVVTLTATANPGWTFTGWSGDLTSTDISTTTTITGHTTITATFAQDDYTLAVNIAGHGSVAVNPIPGHYHYSDVVTLTAISDPEWTFIGWSGDLTGTSKLATIAITGNTTITATFMEGEYTLTVTTIGSGKVAKDPDRAVYRHGDVVTLTATANPGWSFASWSGALSGTNTMAMATITRSIAVTATFTRNWYNLTVNQVGNGSVTVMPTPGPYYYGTVITLTATASPTWAFAGWSGDLTGTANPATTTITGHTTITATFATHRVFLPLVKRNSQ